MGPKSITRRRDDRGRAACRRQRQDQSQTWKPAIRPPGAGDLRGQLRIPPDVVGVDDHADRRRGTARPGPAPRPGGTSTHRSAQNIGCSGSMPSRTPGRCATGTSSPIPSAIMRRASADPGCPAPARRRPGPARRRQRRRLVDGRAVVGQGRGRASGSACVKKPPRHRLDTASPAARTAAAARGQAELGDTVTPQPDRREPVPGTQVHGLGEGQFLTVAWFSESRRCRSCPRCLRQERGHPRDRQGRVAQRARPRRPARTPGSGVGGPPLLQPAQHREVRLQAVQPGQEGDAGLVVGGRRVEDVRLSGTVGPMAAS